jgi:hypothetical protein
MDPETLRRHLDALDTKCAALLQLSGIVLTLGALPAVTGRIEGGRLLLSAIISAVFLVNCLISLTILWYVPEPDERLYELRSAAYKVSVILTGFGLLLIGVLFACAFV